MISGNNFNNADFSVGIPAVQEGDLILLFLAIRQGSGGTMPDGWSLVASRELSSSTLFVYRRAATASAGAGSFTVTGASSSFSAIAIAYQAGTHGPVSVNSGAAGDSTAPQSGAHSPGYGAYQWLSVMANINARTVFAWPYSAGMNETRAGSISIASSAMDSVAASVAPGAYTISDAAQWGALTVAVSGA